MKFVYIGQETETFIKGIKKSSKPIDLKKIDNKRHKVKKSN